MKTNGCRNTLYKPVAIVLSVAGASYLGYFNAYRIRIDWLHLALAALSGGVYFACIIIGPLYIYIFTYLKGVSLFRRILATCFLPFIWMSKDVLAILESHPLVECLYWYFNPLNIWMICLLLVEMGGGTLLARTLLKRNGQVIKVFTPAPLTTALIGITIAAGIYAWGQGENIFSLYLNGYRLLFGGGI